MERWLEKLYAGELAPCDSVVRGNAEYDKLCSQSLREIEAFTAGMDEEARSQFDALMEHYLELTYIEKTQTFCDGFRIGAGIMCEVLGSPSQGEQW